MMPHSLGSPVVRALASLFVLAALPAQITFVDHAATGANDGSSWADAYTDLQAALLATNAGEIWVAAGTYRPGVAGDRAATFQLKSGVALYGGFAGGETMLQQRDVATNVTTLSGDIDQNDTYGSGPNWWQFQWTGSLGNSWHVVTGTGVDASAVLDGFHILAGRGDGPNGHPGGAGLLVNGGSPTLRNCTWQYNAVGFGSSAWLIDCNSTFENCVIKDGYTCNCGIGGWVSGILCTGVCNLSFTDCEFRNHYYVSSQSQGRGAALRLEWDCTTTLLRCRFEGNQTGNFYPIGGGTAMGAAVSNHGTLVADQCIFIDNFAHAGAGMSSTGPLTLTNSLFARNRAVSHPNPSGFDDGDYGAGLYLWGFTPVQAVIRNCTFVDNDCDKGAGICNYGVTTPLVENCIIYHNTGPAALPGETPVFLLKRQIVGNLDLSHCCIEALFATEPGEDPPDPQNFPGCLDAAPLLVDLVAGDYRLTSLSPCTNAGDTAIAAGVADLAGNPRVLGAVDLGCYELQVAAATRLFTTNFVQSWDSTLTVVSAAPGDLVLNLWSTAGLGAGPCLPFASQPCLGILPPLDVLSWGLPDASGRFDSVFTVPVGAPLIPLQFQALALRGVDFGASVVTNTVERTIQQQP
ncbi:MAG TPA: right-handed parallel beta-helix repeat-containing protein [bacterium]|nr:right-handed parallel beta-helix repeat-containing protein [bacterium]